MSNYLEKFEKMRIAGSLASKTLDMITDYVKEGTATNHIDKLCYEFIRDNGGYSAPQFYRGFEKSICTSLNHVVCHGIPSEDRILVEGDALEVQWPSANKVVANIPYQISSPLVEIITRNQSITEVVMLVQEEFAERLVVEWESDRGSLGMCTMLDWDCTFEMRVGPHCFTPSPQVHSRLVTMSRIAPPENSKLTKQLIRQAFSERRKKLRNTLSKAPKRISRVKGWHSKLYREAFQSIDFELIDERPEDLEIEDWLELAQLLEDARRAMG